MQLNQGSTGTYVARAIARLRRWPAAAYGVVLCAALPAVLAQAGDTVTIHPKLWPHHVERGVINAATEQRIDILLSQMSVEEKVAQLMQADISTVTPDDLRHYPLGSVLAGGDSGVRGNDRATPQQWLAYVREFHAAALEPRAGHEAIPLLFGIDAVHGHNNMPGAVIFPHNIALGAAHDPTLVRDIGAATAADVAATGMDWTFAPTVAVPQDLRWGRSYEGYSQDPAQVRAYAQAMVEGLQGSIDTPDPLAIGHVAATAKHFIGDGATASGIDQGNARIDEHALLVNQVQGYEGALDAGVLTVMASYSSWQGVSMHANQTLLTDVLKQRMGFDGFVVGDWNGHALVPGCSNDHCPQAIAAGVDMLMVPKDWKKAISNTVADVEAGRISHARLDDAVRRILRVKFRLGLFENQRPFEGRLELLQSAEQRDLARRAVRESLVLLKNDGVLPIKASARVLVSGAGAFSLAMQCGGWCISWQGRDVSAADFPAAHTVKQGIEMAVRAAGGQLVPESDADAHPPEVAVIIYGEGPYAEMQGDIHEPMYNERADLWQIRRLKSKGVRVVSVFLTGRPLLIPEELAASDAFVVAWQPGTEGDGVADVIIGDGSGKPRYNFQGRLSFRWPLDLAHPSWLPLGYGLSYP